MTLDTALAVIRRAPLRTMDDLNALLNAAHGRLQEFQREFDLAKTLDALADMEHELENAAPITAEDRQQWAADDAAEAWGDDQRIHEHGYTEGTVS